MLGADFPAGNWVEKEAFTAVMTSSGMDMWAPTTAGGHAARDHAVEARSALHHVVLSDAARPRCIIKQRGLGQSAIVLKSV